MTVLPPGRIRWMLLLFALLCGGLLPALAFQVRQQASRFDALAVPLPSAVLSPQSLALDTMDASLEAAPTTSPVAAGWREFRAAHGNRWKVVLDGRSGAPLLVEGEGIPWIAGSGDPPRDARAASLDGLATSLESFVAGRRGLFAAGADELSLNREASGALTPDLWLVQFDHVVSGVPVEGDRYIFFIGHRNLIAFGASRWTPIAPGSIASLAADEARARLYAYLGISKSEPVELVDSGSLMYVPLPAAGSTPEAYSGRVGAGYGSALVWRFVLRAGGEAETWVGLVDATSGGIVALYDDNKYARVKGGVYPTSSDQLCHDGCEQGSYPLPYANLTVNGSPSTANSVGVFNCSPAGGTATTTLAGPYVRVSDTCGTISESVTCEADLDLRSSAGTDCTVPAGASAGDTHSARTSFYHINRIKEHARAWLPSNAWLTQQLTDNVNINLTCNAFWNSGGAAGTVNFYRSGGGCRNSGEIAGVFLHEWGHGLDQNDGGGYDNPSEAYADITAFLSTHSSCIGRGFFQSGHCGGYGNACLTCTGVRDVDWAQRADHVPSTPSGFAAAHCGNNSQGGPCGKEVHCESYVSTEAIWDLAVRDLPASGLDQNTAWQIADRLWYKSRQGSGGNAYTCSLPTSNGCAASSWFSKFRTVDDDDGDLANGTPHAASIFEAFNRHKIACGLAADPSNQNSSTCGSIGAPILSTSGGSGSAALSWPAVPNAMSYNVLRNDFGCASGFTVVANVPGTSYIDSGLANGFTEYYAVQPVGSNTSCLGGLSNCLAVSPGSGSNADLSVSTTDAPDPVVAGQSITYTVTVTNGGPAAATGLQIGGSTPAGTTFQSMAAPAGWSCSAPAVGATGAITCGAPSLAGSSTAVFTIVVKTSVCSGNGTTILNTLTVSSATSDPTLGNNSITLPTTLSDPGTCDDGNPCTQTDTCVSNACVGGNPIACVPSDSCHSAGACDPGSGLCSNPSKADGSACSDGDACTQGEACASGMCLGGAPVVCAASDQCHDAGTCDAGTGCSDPPKPDGAPCNDANACTVDDSCLAGACSSVPAPPASEVNDTLVLSQLGTTTTLSWADGAGPFNLYRGLLAGGATWAYNQTCLAPQIPGPAVDSQSPLPGELFFYLVSRTDACGESIPGRNSLGIPDPNPLPCP